MISKCKLCNIEFKSKPCWKRKYCSRMCANVYKRKIERIKECPCCGIKFFQDRKRKYCSRGCMAKAFSIKMKKPFTCQECEDIFYRKRGSVKHPKFCSKKCFGLNLRRKYSHDDLILSYD